jgi:hypothetical protein
VAPRILIGTAEIAKTVFNLTKGFKELGYEADSLVLPQHRKEFYAEADYTITEVDFLEGTSGAQGPDGKVQVKAGPKLIDFIESYDIFVFVSGTSLLPRMIDLPLLRKMGKTIISRQCGTEVRDTELAKLFWGAHGHKYPYYERDKATPKIACRTEGDLLNLSRYHPCLANKLHNARVAELYADVISSGPPSQTVGVRPYFQSGPIFDSREFRCQIPKRRVPVILHAPSSMLYKQTDTVLQGLYELQDEGLCFSVVVLHNVPHQVVRQKLLEADILIDDLSCGAGVLAYEGMASGCAVLGGHDGVASPMPRNRPILNATAANFKERVKQVVQDVEFRARLAAKGRDFISAGIGSPASVAAYMLEAVDRDRKGDADLYPTLYAQKAYIPDGETMPDFLKERTLQVLLAHGVHPDTDLQRLLENGILPQGSGAKLEEIPRWDLSCLHELGPWILLGPQATYGVPESFRENQVGFGPGLKCAEEAA